MSDDLDVTLKELRALEALRAIAEHAEWEEFERQLKAAIWMNGYLSRQTDERSGAITPNPYEPVET